MAVSLCVSSLCFSRSLASCAHAEEASCVHCHMRRSASASFFCVSRTSSARACVWQRRGQHRRVVFPLPEASRAGGPAMSK